MGLPQLVGLSCAFCHKPVSSIAEGTFCPNCGNPVHVTCLQPGGTPITEGRCFTCGGDAQSPLATDVRAALHREATGADTQVICPNCGSTRGFRPFLGDEGSRMTRAIAFGPLLNWLIEAVTGRELQCFNCDFVFRPRSRLREFSCMLVLLLVVAGLVALAVLPW